MNWTLSSTAIDVIGGICGIASLIVSLYQANELRKGHRDARIKAGAPPDFWCDAVGRGFYYEDGRWVNCWW